jgi:hypothetical protein
MTLGGIPLGSGTLGGGAALSIPVDIETTFLSLHSSYSLAAGPGFYETDYKTDFLAGGVSTYQLPDTDYDDAFDLIQAVSDNTSAVTFSINSTGHVRASAATDWRPVVYDSGDFALAAQFNALWAILGFDTDASYSYSTVHIAQAHPRGTAWIRTANRLLSSIESIVQQGVGVRGHVRQVGLGLSEKLQIRSNHLDKTARDEVQSWYGAVIDGSKASVYVGDELWRDKRWAIHENDTGGVESVLRLRRGQAEFYSLGIMLVDNTNG